MSPQLFQRVVMVDPGSYSVEYSINPWMNLDNPVDKPNAVKQWSNLKDALQMLGCNIEIIPSVQSQPDMVFAANAGMDFGGKVIMSRFKDKERKGEEVYFEEWFRKNGSEVIKLGNDSIWEGEACSILLDGYYLYSLGSRSNIWAYNEITNLMGFKKTKTIELIDNYFYHLDVCLCKLSEDILLLCPLAFKRDDYIWLSKKVRKTILVSYDDALNFACNAVVIAKDIFINKSISEELIQSLGDNGYTVHLMDMGEFIKSGGSTKCLCMYMY